MDYLFPFSHHMLNIGLHNACKEKDVASASEVSESSSGCSAEVGEAAMGTGHAVHALRSPMLSHLFVESQPHPWAIFYDAHFPRARAGDKPVGYVSEALCRRGTRKAAARHIPAALVRVEFPCRLLQSWDFTPRKATAAQQRPQHPSCWHSAMNWC